METISEPRKDQLPHRMRVEVNHGFWFVEGFTGGLMAKAEPTAEAILVRDTCEQVYEMLKDKCAHVSLQGMFESGFEPIKEWSQ